MTPHLHPVGNGYDYQWNVDCSVGRNGQNSLPTDVSYIQWYYTLAAANPLTHASQKQIYRRVRITGACSGREDDPLVAAIFAHQRLLRHPQVDGRVSVAHGASGKFGGAAAFYVYRLGARFAAMFPNAWPRLDLIPGCPPAVAQAVRQCIPRFEGGAWA